MSNVMKKISAALAVLSVSFICSSFSAAQDLPSLPDDPQVSHGVLPDGVEYYAVANGSEKGFADISLVWRLGQPVEEGTDSLLIPEPASLSLGETRDFARRCLSGTGIFSDVTPEDFLKRNGIRGSSCGYIETRDNALVFRFSDINLSKGTSLSDSLFLLVFDLVKEYSGAVRKAGAQDCGQAVIISGDIDRDAVLEKFRMLSLFVPDIRSKAPESNYEWYPGDSLTCISVTVPDLKVATVTAEYDMERVPAEYMKTVLPLVSSQLGEELGTVLKKRLADSFVAEGIPVSGLGYRFSGSSEWGGDETYTLTVKTVPSDVRRVIPVMSSVLSGLSRTGVSVEEYAYARKSVGMRLKRLSDAQIRENSQYVERCISSFLYGASLASSSDRYSFFESSGLADSSGVKFFNRFASSLIDSTGNLTLVCVSDSSALKEHEMDSLFRSSWHSQATAAHSWAVNLSDTSRFDILPVKCRITRSRTEPVSGGVLWEFSNGMKVVYRQMPLNGEFRYSMLVRGGFSSVQGLKSGQGAFFSDILGMYDVCGMKPDEFGYLLSAKDIVMTREVSATDLRISGTAPSGSFWFLMKALIGITRNSVEDSAAFRYYCMCERQRLDSRAGLQEERFVAIDSIMSPGYGFSTLKSRDGLDYGLLRQADGYFRKQFSRMNDGVLVIVGDLDIYELKKKLPAYMGNFMTGKKVMPRGYKRAQTVSGESTYIVDGKRRSLDVAMTAPMQLSTVDYMAAEIAAMAIDDRAMSAISGMAATLQVSGMFYSAPSERLSVVISAEACDTLRFASSCAGFNPVKALFGIRSVLEDLSTEGISQAELDTYKATLKNEIATQQQDPAYWIDVIARRFSNGKDLHTDWSEKIDEVSVDMVKDVIAALDGGGKVEYIVRPRHSDADAGSQDRYYVKYR